jgi:hypothetical protein
MDGQWYDQVSAWNYTQSMHYTFPSISAIVQVSLSSRADYTDFAVPVSTGSAVFTVFTTADGGTTSLIDTGLVSTFRANNLIEVRGLLMAENCYTEAIVNVFMWPVV